MIDFHDVSLFCSQPRGKKRSLEPLQEPAFFKRKEKKKKEKNL